MHEIKVVTIKANSLIHIGGIPFTVEHDTEIAGTPGNLGLLPQEIIKEIL